MMSGVVVQTKNTFVHVRTDDGQQLENSASAPTIYRAPHGDLGLPAVQTPEIWNVAPQTIDPSTPSFAGQPFPTLGLEMQEQIAMAAPMPIEKQCIDLFR